MADNTVLPGTGETYASDDISSVKYQRVKLIHGNDGSNDGDVSTTNPFPTSSNDPASSHVAHVSHFGVLKAAMNAPVI